MIIVTEAEIIINADIEIVFDCSINNENLPKFFTGYKSIPAIVSAETTDGLPLSQGCTRIVKNTDGSAIEEVVIAFSRPTLQKYKLVKGFKPPFSWLVSYAYGQWLYESVDLGTKVTWEFEFEMQNTLSSLIFILLVKSQFQKAQNICLINLKKYVENYKIT